ncbi:MAG: SCO family protein [Gemmatimonadota bacterium]|jgi:protein SCO1/2|nr:MAG: SCO family protein [Gemmatimonadota bacterium]
MKMERREAWALAGLAAILIISAAWWALALWPAGDVPPAWLVRTRAVCFGTRPDGLPGPEGWGALIFQPLGMLGLLLVGWRHELVGGLCALRRRPAGRAALILLSALAVVGAGAVGLRVRVAAAAAGSASASTEAEGAPEWGTFRPEDRAAPELALLDQHGALVRLSDFAGRPLLVTFAFGHCETVCPLVVRETLAARRGLAAAGLEVEAVVLTLDPWRDTPTRLGHLASRLGLAYGERLLGGEPAAVEAALDRWEVPRERDLRTGDIVHPPLVYVVDPQGRIAFAATGGEAVLAGLVRQSLGG